MVPTVTRPFSFMAMVAAAWSQAWRKDWHWRRVSGRVSLRVNEIFSFWLAHSPDGPTTRYVVVFNLCLGSYPELQLIAEPAFRQNNFTRIRTLGTTPLTAHVPTVPRSAHRCSEGMRPLNNGYVILVKAVFFIPLYFLTR